MSRQELTWKALFGRFAPSEIHDRGTLLPFSDSLRRRILGSSQYQATPLRPAALRIVPEKRIDRIGAPLATIEARLCYRPLRLATVQLPQGFLFLRPSTLMHERRGQTGSND